MCSFDPLYESNCTMWNSFAVADSQTLVASSFYSAAQCMPMDEWNGKQRERVAFFCYNFKQGAGRRKLFDGNFSVLFTHVSSVLFHELSSLMLQMQKDSVKNLDSV